MSSLNHLSPIQTTTPASDNEINERQIFLQFALVGDCKTGKTCILNQFSENRFVTEYNTTTAPQSYTAPQIIINDRQTSKKYVIQLQLWDTVGKLPSHTTHATNEAQLISKKPPQSPTNTTVSNKAQPKSHRNTCTQKNARKEVFSCADPHNMELDLVSFFSEIDAKEAMEECKPPQMPSLSLHNTHKLNTNKENINSHSNTAHIDYKTLHMNEPHGYSSGSSPETNTVKPPTTKHTLDILDSDDSHNLKTAQNVQTQETNKFIFECVDALILVYDITDAQSLSDLNHWMQYIAEYMVESEDIPILILGNKTDLEQKRCVSYKDGRKFCQQLVHTHKLFKEISATNALEIKEIFTELARICIDKDYEILQWISSDATCSPRSLSGHKPTYKRNKRSNDFYVKTCAHNFCSKQKEDIEDPVFCVVL